MSRFLCAVAIMLVVSVVHAQTVTQHDDQTVTVRAEGVPIATLLSEIARVYSIERVTIQPGLEQRPVSIVLERVAPAAALVAILKASGLDFAIAGRRIMVGDWTAAGGLGANRQPATGNRQPSTGQHVEDVEAAQQAVIRAAEAEQRQAMSDAAGDESMIMPAIPVRFVADGENITYLEPNFVPYKMRPHVRALRMAIDVAAIP